MINDLFDVLLHKCIERKREVAKHRGGSNFDTKRPTLVHPMDSHCIYIVYIKFLSYLSDVFTPKNFFLLFSTTILQIYHVYFLLLFKTLVTESSSLLSAYDSLLQCPLIY